MTLIHKFETLVLAVILGLIAPVIGLLVFWWGVYALLPESWIPSVALSGILLGLLVDGFFLKRWIHSARHMDIKLWMAIYLFYSVCVFGFFMGVPVFNALLALPAGFVIGGRLLKENADMPRVRKEAGRTALFTTILLALVCAASAFFALSSPSTPSDLRGMLGLGFEVSQGMIIGLIVGGGLALLAFGWGLALVSVRFSYMFLRQKT